MATTTADRRKRNWILIGAVLLLMLMGVLSGSRERLPTPYFDLPHPMVIAHQGGNLLFPGNTLPAFDHAVDLGVDVLEMDLHLSRDGHVMVIHDATVDRTTNGRGAVKDLTLAELQSLDAGFNWPFDNAEPAFRGQGINIPTLEAVLSRYPGQRMLVELKTPDAALAEAVCQLIKADHRESLALVASFHHSALVSFRRVCPAVATGASADETSSFMRLWRFGLTQFYTAPALVLQVPKKRQDKYLLTADWVGAAKQEDLYVDYWTLNDPQEMREAIKTGAAGIITDRPDLLLDELGRR